MKNLLILFDKVEFSSEKEIFYFNEDQKKIAENVLTRINKKLSGKVVTKISLIKNYCPAEEYHQKYLEKR